MKSCKLDNIIVTDSLGNKKKTKQTEKVNCTVFFSNSTSTEMFSILTNFADGTKTEQIFFFLLVFVCVYYSLLNGLKLLKGEQIWMEMRDIFLFGLEHRLT